MGAKLTLIRLFLPQLIVGLWSIFKFHVWDAEFAFVANYGEWLNMWQRKENKSDVNDPKSVYHFVVNCKLGKMQRDDVDFVEMYRKL